MDSRTLAVGLGSFAFVTLAVFAVESAVLERGASTAVPVAAVVGLGVGLFAAARWRRAA